MTYQVFGGLPTERNVACPNQDVVYGFGFADIGAMYGTEPGFYLLAIAPLLEFRRFGLPLPHHWTTISNGAAFGTDYFTRTVVAKSNILVNKAAETKYFYQDLDASGTRLNAARRYTVTFPAGQLPPVHGFWSLTLYNQHHFFAPNDINRYSVGTKNRDLRTNPDGSLTIYVQADAPAGPAQQTNWLPSPKDADFSLYVRAYWPQERITSGQWTPQQCSRLRLGDYLVSETVP